MHGLLLSLFIGIKTLIMKYVDVEYLFSLDLFKHDDTVVA